MLRNQFIDENRMKFQQAVTDLPFLLAEGSVVERLRRNPAVTLDPHIENTACLFDEHGRRAMETIYREYIEIGQQFDFPMIVLTPTWRASPSRIEKADLSQQCNPNEEAFHFLEGIRKSFGDYGKRVNIGGLTGCAGNAYDPAEALTFKEACRYHKYQLQSLSNTGVDFLIASTLPAVPEAQGIAEVMARQKLPYIISFICRKDGTVLDGTPLSDAIKRIDTSVNPQPTGFMLNCIYPTAFRSALEKIHDERLKNRIIGLQANTSSRSPEELDGSEVLDTEDPEIFAEQIFRIHEDCHAKVLGGCCGTDQRHLAALAEKLAQRTERNTSINQK